MWQTNKIFKNRGPQAGVGTQSLQIVTHQLPGHSMQLVVTTY
jgi:hypothetical protein